MPHPFQIDENTYSDGECCFSERNVCNHCREKHEVELTPFQWAEERHSFGYYAGRYCDQCWKNSGFRDANDDSAEFSELDAGESLHGEYDGEDW